MRTPWPGSLFPTCSSPPGGTARLAHHLPLDDVNALWDRRIDLDQYGRMIGDNLRDALSRGAMPGRLLVLHLQPWLIGQPFRIGGWTPRCVASCARNLMEVAAAQFLGLDEAHHIHR